MERGEVMEVYASAKTFLHTFAVSMSVSYTICHLMLQRGLLKSASIVEFTLISTHLTDRSPEDSQICMQNEEGLPMETVYTPLRYVSRNLMLLSSFEESL